MSTNDDARATKLIAAILCVFTSVAHGLMLSYAMASDRVDRPAITNSVGNPDFRATRPINTTTDSLPKKGTDNPKAQLATALPDLIVDFRIPPMIGWIKPDDLGFVVRNLVSGAPVASVVVEVALSGQCPFASGMPSTKEACEHGYKSEGSPRAVDGYNRAGAHTQYFCKLIQSYKTEQLVTLGPNQESFVSLVKPIDQRPLPAYVYTSLANCNYEVKVDPRNLVKEIKESNNQKSVSIRGPMGNPMRNTDGW